MEPVQQAMAERSMLVNTPLYKFCILSYLADGWMGDDYRSIRHMCVGSLERANQEWGISEPEVLRQNFQIAFFLW